MKRNDFLALLIAIVGIMLVGAAIMLVVGFCGQRDRISVLEAKLLVAVIEKEPTGMGGVEVLEPSVFSPVDSWRFPLADGDFMRYTSPFGYRDSPFLDIEVWHEGLDIAGVWRAMVVAVEDGEVIEHWPPPGTPYPGGGFYQGEPIHGGYIVIEHDDGIRTGYSHLSWSRVHIGDKVSAGQVIGRIGNTGMSTGAHLHFSVTLPDGTKVNPLLWIAKP